MTCISAATTILREHSRVKEMDVAAIWIAPAFTIAAGIIMMLDLLHKPKSDSDMPNCRQMVQTAIEGLSMDTDNRMDARGAMILVALLKEEAEGRDQHSSGHGDFRSTSMPDILEQDQIHGHSYLKDSGSSLSHVSINYDELEAWIEYSMPCHSSTDAGIVPIDNFTYGTGY